MIENCAKWYGLLVQKHDEIDFESYNLRVY